MAEISTKPYLIRAIYEWCNDNGYTPYVAVAVDERTQVPRDYVRNGEIVLNVSPMATQRLSVGNDRITFQARFGGVARELSIPIENVSAVYARENGHGMAFDVPKPPADVAPPPRAEAGSPPVLSAVPAPSPAAAPEPARVATPDERPLAAVLSIAPDGGSESARAAPGAARAAPEEVRSVPGTPGSETPGRDTPGNEPPASPGGGAGRSRKPRLTRVK